MRTDDQLYKTPQYWMELIQNDLSRHVKKYMDERELNQSQLANELGVAKTVIAQVLKGKFNYTLSKLIDIALAVGVMPHIEFKRLNEYVLQKEETKSKRQINLAGNRFLPIKAGKTKLQLQQNENGIAISIDVHMVHTIKPAETKIS